MRLLGSPLGRRAIVCALAPLLWAQVGQPGPSQGDAGAVLSMLRQKVNAALDRLPRYLCTETVDRSTFQPQVFVFGSSCAEVMARREKSSWKLHQLMTDRLRLDVAVSTSTEMYSWVGESKFDDTSLGNLVKAGATSTGAFSGFLRSIFAGDAAEFTSDGEITLESRKLLRFRFRVPVDKSHYQIGSRDSHATVGYGGTFLVDPVTSDLVQLTITTGQIPAELRICDTATEISYSATTLNGGGFLIPASVRWHLVNLDGSELESHTAFSGCHEYTGSSSISFEDPPAAPAEAQREMTKRDPLPPNLPFTLTLSTPIDTRTAAAGDRFEARLASGIKVKNSGTLLAPGAKVTGRITAIERSFGSRSETINVGIKVESIETDGVPAPFSARLDPVVRRYRAPVTPGTDELGSFDTMIGADDGSGHLKFLDTGGDIVIRRGLEITGRTK